MVTNSFSLYFASAAPIIQYLGLNIKVHITDGHAAEGHASLNVGTAAEFDMSAFLLWTIIDKP